MSSSYDGVTALPQSLDDVKISQLPSSAFYIADFMSLEEEELLLKKISGVPKPRWKQLSHRRLQTWPSDLSKDTLLKAPLPIWLSDPIIPRILQLSVDTQNLSHHIFKLSPHEAPNHVLINEYQPGQGIMPHEDGSAYFPVVCTVSLGGALCLDIFETEDGVRGKEPCWRILQERRSLLITTDDIYKNYLHGIADAVEDVNLTPSTVANWSLLRSPEDFIEGRNKREVRTSCTFRDVIKVSSLGSKLGFLGRK